ncbi:hypothetical protein [Flavobacterium sp.]|uniref:hypothetical protein n=1 Tax=Flavobacterium sp. TaxID=239 RepID=UPI004034252D
MKKLIHTEALPIASGSNTIVKRFTPQSGRILGCSFYHNNSSSSPITTGTISAKITTDSGEDIIPMCDIRHYRNRDAAYNDGLVPMDYDTCGKTLEVTIVATANFSANFNATLVLVYDKEYLN